MSDAEWLPAGPAAAAMTMELECTMDGQEVIVLDNGSGYLKFGLSGEDAPRAVLPTAVTVTTIDESREDEHAPIGADSQAQKKSQSFFGDEALAHSAEAHAVMTCPVQRGQVRLSSSEKDALESLWDHTFRTVLGGEPEDLPILIADPLPLGQAAYAARSWMAEVMFEKFKVKSLAIFNTAVLSLFSTGRTRGLVVESGEGITQAVPVFEGYAVPHAIFKMEIAGSDITNKVMKLIERQDFGAQQAAVMQYAAVPRVMQALKEKVCSVALDFHSASKRADMADEESKSFELPDGKIIQIHQAVRMGAPEILFGDGGRSGDEPSMQKICMEAIHTCDADFQQDLVKSLVVAGGSSMLPGLAPRLRSELGSMLSGDMARQVDICVDSQRRYAAWIGGSMFASLSTFEQVAITRTEFDEGKADVRGLVARKTF